MKTNIYYGKILLLVLIGLSVACGDSSTDTENKIVEKVKKPTNIILIVADDLGYGDLGIYGQQQIKTPFIDSIANQSVLFTQFYSGSTVGVASSCALLTGKHTGHTYIRGNTTANPPANDVPLRETDTIIPQILKNAGYITGMFGKWDLGKEGTPGEPVKKGWDEFLGFVNPVAAHSYYVDTMFMIEENILIPTQVDSSKYSHDIIMNAALDFIRNHKDTSFFMYLPVTLPHAELNIPEKELQTYLTEDGKSIFKEIPFPGMGTYGAQDKPKAAYAAMVSKLDRDIEKLFSVLNQMQIDSNTVVIFTSDNGPHGEGGYRPEYFNSQGNLRGMKRELYEGGIRVPMLIYALDTLLNPHIENNYFAAWDILPTIIEIANIEQKTEQDGISMLNVLKGTESRFHDFLYWEYYRPKENLYTQAVRKDSLKALRYKIGNMGVRFELYNLLADTSETKNIANDYPQIVEEITKIMENESEKPENENFHYSKEFFQEEL